MWWNKYIGKVPSAGISYPEENWVSLHSRRNNPLATYRFHHASPRSVVILLHGYTSCSESLAYIASQLFSEGYAVLAMDQEGHGKSGGRAGQIVSIADYMEDTERYVNIATEQYPKTPIFLLGESMGGMLSIAASLRVPASIRGMILFAPAVDIAGSCSCLGHAYISCMNCFCPSASLDFTSGREVSSNNPHYAQWTYDNPCVFNGRTEFRTFKQISKGMKYVQSRMEDITTPVLAFHGGEDTTTNVADTKMLIDKALSRDKKLVYVPQMRHAISSEPYIDDIIQEISRWIDKRV